MLRFVTCAAFLLALVAVATSLSHGNVRSKRAAGDIADVAARYIQKTEHYIDAPDQMMIKLYARNKKPASLNTFTASNVVLMVHGASYPSESAYDLQLDGFSWMDYIAAHGYDVWCMDVRGYGMSSRPAEMAVNATLNGPIVRTIDAANDVKTVANYIMALRGVNQHIAIGWSWGTSIMSTYTSLNPTKVSKLVIYAPQWFRAPNAAPTTAYRTITRQAAYDRWVKDVPVNEIPDLLPGNVFDLWWNATVATDPLANTFNPPAVRAPNGIQLDNSFFWGNGTAPYDISLISCPTLVIRGDWDVDLPLSMAQSYYANLTNVPYKRFAQISEGTHTLLLEKNRMELFLEVQLFLDQAAAETKSTPFASGYVSPTAAQPLLPRVGINTTDYYVNSTVAPGIRIFVRNKNNRMSFSESTTVLMVHGATYPASTAFDLKLDDISWMEYLASHGYDVWSIDIRGYGYSDRPAEMEVDPTLNGPIVRTADAADDIKDVANFVMQLRGLSKHAAIGWSWGTSTMTRYVSLNPSKVSKLVIYAPQWLRAANTAPTTAYRVVNRDGAYTRWVTGLSQSQITALLPGSTFDIWWNATVATDPTANTRTPASIRAPNGIQLDNSFFWGNGSAPYDIDQLICPVLVVRGDLDIDLNLNMSQSYYNALRNVPYRKFTQISMGTHTIVLEKYRFELFRQVQLFLDEKGPTAVMSPFQSFARTVAAGPGAPNSIPTSPLAGRTPTNAASGLPQIGSAFVVLLASAALWLL